MPTIDQLSAAVASSDTDELVTTQSGTSRKVTRAQLLAGLQPAISVPPGALLGNSGSASAGPLPITVGSNLSMANGVLTGPAPFIISSLPGGSTPSPTDLVALSQNGIAGSVSYAEFLSGLGTLPGFNASTLMMTPTGASAQRSLATLFGDALTVEDFGALGDGATDDTAAFHAAITSLRPILLGPRTYILNNTLTLTSATALSLIGVAGQTVIRRLSKSTGSAWITLAAPFVHVEGVTFDGNTSLTGSANGVIVPSTCLRSTFDRCTFSNVVGGAGLTFQPADPTLTRHTVLASEFFGNATGINCQAADGLTVSSCHVHDNSGTGIEIDYVSSGGTVKSRLAVISGNHCWNNFVGISIGDYTSADASPALISNKTADGMLSVISGNNCHDNAEYGIAAQGYNLAITGNIVYNNGGVNVNNGGILANCWASSVTCNLVSNHLGFGIDAGAANFTFIASNFVSTARIGINAGGAQEPRIIGNSVINCSYYGIVIYTNETDAQGDVIGVASQQCSIVDNVIDMPSGGGGILLIDGPQFVQVSRNNFITAAGADLSLCLLPLTDSVAISGNLVNGEPGLHLYDPFVNNVSSYNGLYTILFPDVIDNLWIQAAAQPVQSICSMNASNYAQYVTFLRLTAGGSGYTSAPSVAISGGGGSGATAVAFVSNGAVVGFRMQSLGSGYTSAPTVALSGGGGSGATATANIGVPVHQGRRLRILSTVQTEWATGGSNPPQTTPTTLAIKTPANSEVEWLGFGGGWYAADFDQVDYVQPATDGSLTLHTISGDLRLHPSGSGAVRWVNDSQSTGCTTTVGSGAPNGVVNAPPGSDYRNLTGSAGSIFWIKQTGTGTSGWIAVA